MKYTLVLCLIILMSFGLKAQSVNNIIAQQFGNNIEITYQVSNTNEPYHVSVFYTMDNKTFSNPLKHVYGDVGQNISGNGSKKIIWDVLREQEGFDGNYAFKVVVTPVSKAGSSGVTTKTPVNSGETVLKTTKGSFEAEIKSVKTNSDKHVLVSLTLTNIVDNENFKVHITKSGISGPDGKKYLAKSARMNGGKDQYGFINVVLSKDVPVEVTLVFDYVPENMMNIVKMELIRSVSFMESDILTFNNLTIER